MAQAKVDQKPKQARAVKTEQALLDALERLLETTAFADVTVSKLAAEAGLTTGAIYRRFADKNDVLRSAFHRFLERTEMHDAEYPVEMPDQDVLTRYFGELMHFTLDNIHLMRAANSLNDLAAFDQMTEARTVSATWLASRLQSSQLRGEELTRRCQFVLRIATATFRDTFLSGRGAVAVQAGYRRDHREELEQLCADLTDLARGYLALK